MESVRSGGVAGGFLAGCSPASDGVGRRGDGRRVGRAVPVERSGNLGWQEGEGAIFVGERDIDHGVLRGRCSGVGGVWGGGVRRWRSGVPRGVKLTPELG